MENVNGAPIACYCCSGSGLVLGFHGEPMQCVFCDGNGTIWRYGNGTISRYYGGPLLSAPSGVNNGRHHNHRPNNGEAT